MSELPKTKQLGFDRLIVSNKVYKKKAYEEKVAREAVEREAEEKAAWQHEIAQPEYPIREFCLGMGEMPYEGASENWGYCRPISQRQVGTSQQQTIGEEIYLGCFSVCSGGRSAR
jgi:hypothetical protein